MIRRAILVAAAAVAVILVPSAAMAYNAPGFSSSVSDATPAVGQSVTVIINGGAASANQVITLRIAGAITKTLTARGRSTRPSHRWQVTRRASRFVRPSAVFRNCG
jgi:hypothetical protein